MRWIFIWKKYTGKGYNKKGKIIYELNKGNGKVKEFNEEGIILYEGELLNGKLNSKGKEYKHFIFIIKFY